MGLGQFSECGLVSCLLWLRNDINFITIYTIINHPVNQPHHLCVPAESPDWESGVSSLVCLCHGSVYCACSMPEVCQCVRGSSLKCLCFPGCFLEVPAVLDVLKAKSLCHCARWLKTHKTVLMAQIYCNDDFSMFYSLMWWPIGCVCHH